MCLVIHEICNKGKQIEHDNQARRSYGYPEYTWKWN